MTSRRLHYRVFVCMFFVSACATLQAQQADKNESLFPHREQGQSQTALQNIKIAAMDGAIDPHEYIVGPGDIYSVNVWSGAPLSVQLPVTPEGSVIIPTVGEIQVAGLRLDAAKKKVMGELRKKYSTADMSFTLYAPRLLAATVRGVVLREGTVYVQSTDRVDVAIALANAIDQTRLLRAPSSEDVSKGFSGALTAGRDTIGSLRKIVVRHRDGTQSSADLERYFVHREHRYNPLVQDGDVISVPKQAIDRDFIGVFGAVNKEGDFEYVEGDSLTEALAFARGLTALADSEHVEVIRSDERGNALQTLAVNLRDIAHQDGGGVLLRRGDRVVVKEKPQMRRDFKVYVGGEVFYPGYYPITRDSTGLWEVIRMAGGLRETASLEASRVYRKYTPPNGKVLERLESARGAGTQEDSLYYRIENAVRTDGELVITDFVGLFANNDRSKDIFLHDGDHVYVAARQKTVYVYGQVLNPGHVPFEKNEGYKYYVAKAGGFAEEAVKGEVRIIKSKNQQLLLPSETTIEDGDFVWVPREPYRPFSYYISNYSQLLGIIGSVGTLIILFLQLKK